MIDTHCHLDYLDDPSSARSELGLTGVVCIGANLEHAHNAISLAEQFDNVWATVGLHPTDIDLDTPKVRRELEQLALHPRVVAIGESGLDTYWDDNKYSKQLAALEWQLDLACSMDKPIVLHVRDRTSKDNAHQGVMDVLSKWPSVQPILHCFSGHPHLLEFGIDRGAYFGFAGNTTYRNAHAIQKAAQTVPLDHLLLETDAPFLAPMPQRGKPNRPGYICHTLEFIANLRGLDVKELEHITDTNAQRVYKLNNLVL